MITRYALNDIGITWINNAEAAYSEIFSTGSAQVNIISIVVMNSNLGQHSIIFNLRLSQRRTIVGDDDKLPL